MSTFCPYRSGQERSTQHTSTLPPRGSRPPRSRPRKYPQRTAFEKRQKQWHRLRRQRTARPPCPAGVHPSVAPATPTTRPPFRGPSDTHSTAILETNRRPTLIPRGVPHLSPALRGVLVTFCVAGPGSVLVEPPPTAESGSKLRGPEVKPGKSGAQRAARCQPWRTLQPRHARCAPGLWSRTKRSPRDTSQASRAAYTCSPFWKLCRCWCFGHACPSPPLLPVKE